MVFFGKSKLCKSVLVTLPHIAEERERWCVCVRVCAPTGGGGYDMVWFVLCRSICETLWEDELRGREKRNAVVLLVLLIAQEM